MWPTFRNLNLRVRVNGAHSSSRFSRLPATVLWALTLYARGRSIVSFTEVGNNARLAMLRKLPGWKVAHIEGPDGRDECAIAYREKRWRVIRKNVYKVTDDKVPFLGYVWSLDVLFEHYRTGQTLMWSVLHAPARVEDGDKWGTRSPADVRGYKQMLRKWTHNLNNYQNDRDIDHVVAGGDMNLNLHRPVWRNLLWGTYGTADLTSIWKGRMPSGGSHENSKRLIDDLLTDLTVLASGVYALNRASDHKTIWFKGLMRRIKVSRQAWIAIVADRHRRWGVK